eukprot:GFYU01003142.1.p1 GENE.GFYU01003142.1~~GFYU01003142.1.p1  ORF type:complete len:304 (-),score=88.45 GFYU01003142.1:55-966(-)
MSLEPRKAKTRRGKKFLENRAPKVVENPKSALILKGANTSEVVTAALKDLYLLKKPLAVKFQRKNQVRPFEDETSLEFFSQKSDCSLFVFGSHQKKRPNNLVFGRMFDFHLLNMVEFGVTNFKPMESFKKTPRFAEGFKPCIMFIGQDFEQEDEYKHIKSLFLDFFRGREVTTFNLAGVEHLLVFTAVEGTIYLRAYGITFMKSGTKFPRVELEEIGPSIDLKLRRTKHASDDVQKESMKQAKGSKVGSTKNITTDTLKNKLGRIHMAKQDLDDMAIKRFKGTGAKRGSDYSAETASKKAKTT